MEISLADRGANPVAQRSPNEDGKATIQFYKVCLAYINPSKTG
jgi:hypothetical protein